MQVVDFPDIRGENKGLNDMKTMDADGIQKGQKDGGHPDMGCRGLPSQTSHRSHPRGLNNQEMKARRIES